ncbi:putative Ig domain-containing protein [Compostibacter hankyongensis]|uniref:Alpha-galactosidase n=1 Tax=Compostibacter hankyongensis TaxID=1007089 RepID=A0ABP8G0A0_9BACT
MLHRKKLLCWIAAGLSLCLQAQAQVSLDNGWKFRQGDDTAWAAPAFNDDGWKAIKVGTPWEYQGYDNYDGYGWYRLHVKIPASLRSGSANPGDLRIELGKIDDGDEVYLNGKRIGANAGKKGSIKKGPYDALRVYRVGQNDPAIRWDGDNVIAVRVYDHSGNGGMWEGPYRLSITDITDDVQIDPGASGFSLGDHQAGKSVTLHSSHDTYRFSGMLHLAVIDPQDGKTVWEKTVPAAFSAGKDFHYTFTASVPEQRSYQLRYTFRDSRSDKDVTAVEGIPYILTPPAPPTPRINGAKIAGVRPGHPFLFRIPATGAAPLRFSAAGLPAGLKLDPASGIITGSIDQAGAYTVKLTVSNKRGKATEDFRIVAGARIALTPAMGWNSWNCWGLSVSDAKVKASADAMVSKGLVSHGWTYINIDDGWERETRAANGEIVTNDKFPDMKKLADYVHDKGLKIGIYSSPGPRTCGGFLGSYQHELQDAKTYARWGIDYLKYDWCSYGNIAPKNPDLEALQKPYRVMQSAFKQIDRDIYFSLCQYGMGDVWKWGDHVGGNSWRTTGDIRDTWKSMSDIGFRQYISSPYAKPGNWNDPDMLVVGKVGWGPNLHNTRLSPDEQYTHISLWCLLSSPLLIGCDMSQLDDFTLSLLTNDEVLAVDQDPLGNQAKKVAEKGNIQIWAKNLEDGSKAVGIFNLGPKMTDADLDLSRLHRSGKQTLRDLWRQQDLGTFSGIYHAQHIPSHGVLLLKVSAARR